MQLERILTLVSVTACLLAPMAAAEEAAYVQHENVVYGETDGVGLVMDIFTPRGDGNGLGIIDVVSGAWHSDRGKIRDHTRAQVFQILCNEGYTVFAVRPGSITKFGALEMIDHLNEGIRWVKGHADVYRIDPNRLGLMGASAGGHLACLAAVTATSGESNGDSDDPSAVGTAVRAVAVFFPPTDFLDFGGKVVDARADDGFGQIVRSLAFPQGLHDESESEVSEALKRISPAHLVTPKVPPFLLIHGDADPVVPLQQSQRMLDALKQAGVPAELIVKEGGGHPWLTMHEEVKVMSDWFNRQLEAK